MRRSRGFGHGLVIGKFYPFHAGHQALVRAATSTCDHVTVEVMVQGVESIPASVRVGWVQGEHPDARVVAVLDDAPVDFESPEVWDLHMTVIEAALDGPVDAVFSSDTYGEELARRLGAKWVQVDPGRASTPISGTAIRHDPAGNWWALPTPVRQWFTKRVVVLGADPAGRTGPTSTTLARSLAGHYGIQVVPDHTPHDGHQGSGSDERRSHTDLFELRAARQAMVHLQAAGLATRPLLICESHAEAVAFALERSPYRPDEADTPPPPSLYVLVGDDTPPSRVRSVLEQHKAQRGTPWVAVTGPLDDQLAVAIGAIDAVIAAGWPLTDPLG